MSRFCRAENLLRTQVAYTLCARLLRGGCRGRFAASYRYKMVLQRVNLRPRDLERARSLRSHGSLSVTRSVGFPIVILHYCIAGSVDVYSLTLTLANLSMSTSSLSSLSDLPLVTAASIILSLSSSAFASSRRRFSSDWKCHV